MSKRTPKPSCPEDVQVLLSQDLSETRLHPARSAALKQRVLTRAHADARHGGEIVRALEGRWEIFLPGIQIKVLHQTATRYSYLLKLEPGAILPPHHHPVAEECIVLKGKGALRALMPASVREFLP